MPGFGSGPFGGGAFGEFSWARQVLFETAPEVYRTADVDQLFELYARAQGEVFDDLRRKIRDFGDLRDPRLVRSAFDETTTILLGQIQLVKGPVEQRGIRAQVLATSVIQTERGRFTFADVGKELTVSESSLKDNNREVVITSIVSPTEVLTNPPLTLDAGPLRWEVRELQASTTNETIVEVVAGDVEPIAPGWILTDGFAEFEVLARKQFFSASDERKLLTNREGSDGVISSTPTFNSLTATFEQKDVGRRITISGSTALAPSSQFNNNDKFEIVEVLSPTEVVLDSPFIFQDPGPLDWAMLRRSRLTLSGSSTLRGVVEQVGEDMTTTGTGFTAPSGEFTDADEGKLLTVYADSDVNNGIIFEVDSVTSANEVVTVPVPTGTASTYRYELRTETEVGDLRQVEVRAPSLLRFLARDFGIETDNREDEEFQRRWVDSVSRWIDLKGTEDGYKYLAQLTGYDATCSALYRVSQEIYLSVLASGGTTYKVGEGVAGSFGLDGSLNVVGGRVRFSSPTATFAATDIGKTIDVSNTSGTTNDGLRTIETVISPTEVEFRVSDGMTGASDANNGTIVWLVVRLYAEEAPLLPVYDEINSDRMTYLKGASVFKVDKYCWEQLPSPWSTLIGFGADGVIVITSVTPSTPSAFPQVVSITGRGDFDVVTGLGIGKWKLTNFGTDHFLETVPRLRRSAEEVPATFDATGGPYTIVGASGDFDNVTAGDLAVTSSDAQTTGFTDVWRVASATSDTLTLDASYGALAAVTDAVQVYVLLTSNDGVDGSLTGAGPVNFGSPTAGFSPFFDEGRRLIIGQSGLSNGFVNAGAYRLDSYVSGVSYDLDGQDTPTTPDTNNGSLTWGLVEFEFTVIATTPPSTGVSTIEYICPELLTCDYCKSHRIRIEATTPFTLEGGVERLRDRIQQGTPKHVEVIEAYGASPLATLAFTASGTGP
jgi:hypothetical protein